MLDMSIKKRTKKERSTYIGEANIEIKNIISLVMTRYAWFEGQDDSFLPFARLVG